MVLPATQFYQEERPKNQIVIHHTVGGSARSTFNWWLQDPGRIGTAFIIDRDGSVFQVFESRFWAHHLGLTSADNTKLNKTSIGIELASEGPLEKKDGVFYAYDGLRKYPGGNIVRFEPPFRGREYMDAYDMKQILSCFELVELLCRQFGIKKEILPAARRFQALEENKSFQGVIGHCDVRPDKTDPHPFFPWDEMQRFLLTLEIIPERLTLWNMSV